MEMEYKTIKITQVAPNSRVFNLFLNRPSTLNALSPDFFIEFPQALSSLDQNPNVALILLSANGDHFCAGIDLKSLTSISGQFQSADRGHTGERLRRDILFMQQAITAIEKCRKPVIATIHGACVGGGIDIITACDIRFCTETAFFSVKEVDLAITADLGKMDAPSLSSTQLSLSFSSTEVISLLDSSRQSSRRSHVRLSHLLSKPIRINSTHLVDSHQAIFRSVDSLQVGWLYLNF